VSVTRYTMRKRSAMREEDRDGETDEDRFASGRAPTNPLFRSPSSLISLRTEFRTSSPPSETGKERMRTGTKKEKGGGNKAGYITRGDNSD